MAADEKEKTERDEEPGEVIDRARRKLLRIGVYTAPAVIGTLLMSSPAHAAPPVSCAPYQCKPAPCHPKPCAPTPCPPTPCAPKQ